MVKIKCVCLVWAVFTSALACAQSEKLFSTDKELSNSLVNDVMQDRNGIIWIATEDGLNQYDGSKFTGYKHDKSDSNSLQNNLVRLLFEDSQGRLLIGLFNGLQIYDFAADTFKEIPLIIDDGAPFPAHVLAILERRSGEILIGTSGHGIFSLRLDRGETRAKQVTGLIPSVLINYLFEDADQNLWVSTQDKGLFRVDKDKNLKNFFGSDDASNYGISSICGDREGRLYVGCMTKGVFQFDKNSDSFTPIPNSVLPELPVRTLYLSKSGEIYIGTDGKGMKIYDPRTRKITEKNFNISTFNFEKSKVHSIMEDKAGNIWLGLYQKGVMLLPARTSNFGYIGHKSIKNNIIGSNCIMSVFKDHEEVLWVGTDNDGIYAIGPAGRQRAHFTSEGETYSVPSTVMCIYEDSNHDLWLGSYLNGMGTLNRNTGEFQQVKLLDVDSNAVHPIFSIVEDREKNLWIGSMGSGLYCMNLNTGKIDSWDAARNSVFRTDTNQLHNSWINSLLITRDDKLYIGTYDGLGCMDLKTRDFLSTHGTTRLVSGEIIYTLYEDNQGNIWMGTANGLMCLNSATQQVSVYTTKDGLPSNVICAIKGDEANNLWISANYGISRMNLKDRTFTNYYASDGLQDNEFSKNSAFVDANGQMIFGGINGITYFNPHEIKEQKKKLEIRITDFYIHDQPVKKGTKSGNYDIIDASVMNAKTFNLCHNDNSFSIEFSAMEFNNPERITYMYAMNTDDWITLRPGTNRVSFSNLAPGEYHFKVKAKDYGVFSDVKEISIIIHPAWYASPWAKLIYFLITVAIGFLIVQQVRHRIRARRELLEHIHAEEINEAKLQFFINVSHEIRTPVSLIINPLKKLMMTDEDDEHKKAYQTMHRNSERILNLINQLMDVRRIDKGQLLLKFQEVEIVGFVKDLYSIFEDQAKAKHIDIIFNSEVKTLHAWVDPKNFDKIIINVLSNALKFTNEYGKVNIHLSVGQDESATTALRHYFEIVIADTGIGIGENEMERIFERFYQIRKTENNSKEGTGIGLHLTRSLVELHHGAIKAENNTEGSGSRFIVRLPLGKDHLKPEEIERAPSAAHNPDHAIVNLPVPEEAALVKTKGRSKHRILIVDDDSEMRNYIREELAPEYQIIECENGKEALAAALDKTPKLIISDVIMPEMDGIALCSKIRQNVNINHIPIILLTARSSEEDNLEGLSIGADAYIPKPFNIKLLKKTIENLIRSRMLLQNKFNGNQGQKDRIEKITMKSADEKLLERVMDFINKNIGNPDLNVETLSKQVGISRVHLHRKLKELTNQSTRDLIRNIRLKQAGNLLAAKNLSVSEVAYATGFINLTHFSNAFKEFYGMPPTSYMEEHLRREETEENRQ